MRNNKYLTRREFLKISGASALALLGADRLAHQFDAQAGMEQQRANVIILLFDALSSRNMSLYGYPRQTTPNLEKFAERATVFYRHYSSANYTVPSTASLFTGTYSWTNGAFHGLPVKSTQDWNLFHIYEGAYRVGFSQNLLADMILYQYAGDLDFHPSLDEFSLASSPVYRLINRVFSNDGLAATLASQGFLYSTKNKAGSLFISLIDKVGAQAAHTYYRRKLRQDYPANLPYSYLNNMIFDQRAVFDGAFEILKTTPAPSLVYLHFWSPHDPYRPKKEFLGMFDANPWQPLEKPEHPLDPSGKDIQTLNALRTRYDENIAHIDDEFGRLIDQMEKSGLLENSYLIVTSDHGEMFERGVDGHTTPLLYEPLIHVPLLIRQPGQRTRQDVFSSTSNIDLLPTLLHLNGQVVPEWCEGRILPGFGGQADPNRSIFAIEAKKSNKNQPLTQYSIAMIKGRYKLIAYQYPDYENQYELYDLESDPEEMDDLMASNPEVAGELKAELLANLKEVNQQLQNNNDPPRTRN
jgi:arylsulfatase A-like enzyme